MKTSEGMEYELWWSTLHPVAKFLILAVIVGILALGIYGGCTGPVE